MIYGVGTDIVKIKRIRDATERWGRKFLQRIMTDREIDYCYDKSDPYPSLAARFAAREALIKALGWEVPFAMTDAEVVNNARGKPGLKTGGRLAGILQEASIARSHLSLSHEKEFAVAVVILEQ